MLLSTMKNIIIYNIKYHYLKGKLLFFKVVDSIQNVINIYYKFLRINMKKVSNFQAIVLEGSNHYVPLFT